MLPARGSGSALLQGSQLCTSHISAEVFIVSYTSENCILWCISPLSYSEIWLCCSFIGVKYWYSQAILIKTIQKSCSFLELEKQIPTPSVNLAVAMIENCQCFLFQTYLFSDFHGTIPHGCPATNTFISCQFRISLLMLGCIFLNVLLRENFCWIAELLFSASRIGSLIPGKS